MLQFRASVERITDRNISLVLVVLGLLLVTTVSGCSRRSSVCDTTPPDQPIETRQSLDISVNGSVAMPSEITIRNRPVVVDQIVHGSLCDGHWSGTVYIDCDTTVPTWDAEAEPTFFDGCDLTIDEDATIYVAYHNDEAYYKGCSCHYSE